MDITNIPMPRPLGMTHMMEFALPEDLILEQWFVPKGTMVKTWQTENFGWVCLPPECHDTRGFTIPRRLFKY